MGEPVTFGTETEGTDEGFAALVGLENGFLGTGYAADVELAFIGMALIAGWVIVETTRYVLAVTGAGERLAEKLGLRDE